MRAISSSDCCFNVGALLSNRPHEKHRSLLDLATWDDEPSDDVEFVQATGCSKYQGILDADGIEESSPNNIYVDGNLIADTRSRMPKTLVAAAQAIFAIMGQPMLHLRQCAVAMDTWRLLVTSQSLILLDLVFNTQKMTVGMTKEYR